MFFFQKKANHVGMDIHMLAEQTPPVSLQKKYSMDRVHKTVRVRWELVRDLKTKK